MNFRIFQHEIPELRWDILHVYVLYKVLYSVDTPLKPIVLKYTVKKVSDFPGMPLTKIVCVCVDIPFKPVYSSS